MNEQLMRKIVKEEITENNSVIKTMLVDEVEKRFERSVGGVFEEFTSQSKMLAEMIVGIDEKLDRNIDDHESRISRIEQRLHKTV
jgi:hypothetical protein